MPAKLRKAPKPAVLREFFGFFSRILEVFPAVSDIAVAVATGNLHGRDIDLKKFRVAVKGNNT